MRLYALLGGEFHRVFVCGETFSDFEAVSMIRLSLSCPLLVNLE